MKRARTFLFRGALTILLSAPASGQISLRLLGTYATDIFNASGTEISAYDPNTKRLFSTNVRNNAIDIVDISDPRAPRSEERRVGKECRL